MRHRPFAVDVTEHFGLAVAALATVAASAGLVVFGLGPTFAPPHVVARDAPARKAAPTCQPIPSGLGASAALRVETMFIRTAVLRRHTGCSYDLVTPELRRGYSRTQWAAGNIPVQPFPTTHPQQLRAGVMKRVARAHEREAWVVLQADDLGEAVFDLVLVQQGGRWRVSYWAPAVGYAVPAAG